MFIYHEKSECISVSADLTVRAVEKRLRSLDRTLGYLPIEGDAMALTTCLLHRLPNRYFFRYGDIADLCIGWKSALDEGKPFTAKPYPRAATGADFRQLFIGGGTGMGMKIEECTLRVFPIPLEEIILVYSFETAPDVDSFVFWMLDHFIFPIGVWSGPAKRLPRGSKRLTLGSETIMIVGLAGEGKILKEEVAALGAYLELRKGKAHEVSAAVDKGVLSQLLHGHHPQSGETITSLEASLPMSKEPTKTQWLALQWPKVREQYAAMQAQLANR